MLVTGTKGYFLIFLMGLFVLSSASLATTMELIANNSYLELYFDEKTHRVAVQDQNTGHIWYSSPVDLDSAETLARGTTKTRLKANVVLVYSTPPPNHSRRTRDSYHDSVLHDQAEVIPLSNGLRIEYTIGRVWVDSDYLPTIMNAQHYEEFVAGLSDEGQSLAQTSYIPMTLVPHDGHRRLTITGLEKEKVFGDYSVLPLSDEYQDNLQELRSMQTELDEMRSSETETTQAEQQALSASIVRLQTSLDNYRRNAIRELLARIRESREAIQSVLDHSFSDVEALIDNPTYVKKTLSILDRRRLVPAIMEAGYTPIDVAEAYTEYRFDPPQENVERFDIPVEFLLEGPSLVVRIPTDEISYPHNPDDVKDTYPIRSIELLPFFGAAGRSEHGYIFIPDGCGALIELNSDNFQARPVRISLYGPDFAVEEIEQRQFREQAFLPVYGMKVSDQAFLGIIEEGEAFASLTADIAGRAISYNTVSPSFILTQQTQVNLYGGDMGTLSLYQPRIFQGDLRIRYLFLEGEQASYSGMAASYRQYLIDQHRLDPIQPAEAAPFFLELSGAVPTVRSILGFPIRTMASLTTYQQAQKIVERLLEEGIDNLRVRFEGWLKNGIEHLYPETLALERAVGTQGDLTNFRDYVYSQAVDLFLHASLINVYPQRGFSTNSHTARYLNRLPIRLFEFELATGLPLRTRYRYVLAPSSLPDLVERFMANYERLGVAGLSLAYLGNQLSSDYVLEAMFDRQQVLDQYRSELARLSKEYRLLVDGGQIWTLPYVDAVLRVPSESSNFRLVDENVPFMQMVLSGLVAYAGQPITQQVDWETALLQTIETGGSIYAKMLFAESRVLKNTDFKTLIGLNSDKWLEDTVAFYRQANSVLHRVHGVQIIQHEKLATDVYRTYFANDLSVIVNYNEHPITINDLSIPAMGFLLLEE